MSDHGLASPSAYLYALLKEAKRKGHYTQSHYAPLKRIPPKYWACKGGVLKSVFITRFGPTNNKLGACNIIDPNGKLVNDILQTIQGGKFDGNFA